MNNLLIVVLAVGFFAESLCVNSADGRLALEAYRNATRMQNLQEMFERQLFNLNIVMRDEDIAVRNLRNFGQPIAPSVREAFRVSKILLKTGQYLHRVFYSNVTKTDLSEKDFYTWLHDLSRYLPVIADTARWKVRCNPRAPYRLIDGSCNSLMDPSAGSAFSTFSRITLPNYDDDIHVVRRDSDYMTLPLARNIVVYLFRNYSTFENYADQLNYDRIPNMAALMFSQFVAHDVAQKIQVQNMFSDNGIQCCARRNSRVLPQDELNPACIPIQVSPRDPVYQQHSVGCINLIRSETISPFGKTLSAAQQLNHATGQLDVSGIYGSTDTDSRNLRAFRGGRLLTNADNILPEELNCTSNACYRSGDSRVNQTPFLAIQNSLFVRHHNHMALILSTLNSQWSDEKLFQEARRIVIAHYQHIIYTEFLPAFFGSVATAKVTFDSGERSTKTRANTANEFTTAAFRIFHLFLPNNFILLNALGNVESLRLSDTVFNSSLIRGYYEDILRGFVNQRINLEGYSDEVLHRLFKNVETEMGFDLLSADILRGRDHGLKPYVKYLDYCGYKNIKKFEDLSCVHDYQIIAKLKKVYRSVEDIDLMVGGALENTNGELIGPTFKCIIMEQFRRYRVGDRFFYDRTDCVNPFTSEQLNEIRKFTVAHLYCGNSNIESVPRNSFITPRRDSDFLQCKNLPRLQYSAWREARP